MTVHAFAAFIILLSVHPCRAQETTHEITTEELRTHIMFLSSDELEGRGSGTPGNEKAARYIADHFDRLGLEPIGDDDSYFQRFEFTSAVELGPENAVRFSGDAIPGGPLELIPDVDFRPFGLSSSGQVSGEVVFAGYGISAPDEGYDDYESLDVTGKVVVVLRYSPEGDSPHSDFGRHATFRSKARFARENGAAALIIITGLSDDLEDELIPLAFDQSVANSGLPVISMKRSAFDQLLIPFGQTTEALQDSINVTGSPVGMHLTSVIASARTDVTILRSTTSNIVGYLPAADETESTEVLVVGAHMDHLGYGGPGSGSLDPTLNAIHNGADDNASGTSGLLELAELYSSLPSPPRGIVFAAFSGEELGTLGSAYYVANSPIPLHRTIAMINMDMIGRLEDSDLTVYGTGSSPLWDELLDEYNEDELFKIAKVSDGFGPSDHAQFYGKDIPVLFFFTGTHDDYHKPTDDWDKINYEGQKELLGFVSTITEAILQRDERPEFVRVTSTSADGSSESGRTSFRVTLGVVPDYASEGEGMKIGGVKPGGPAENAGLLGGDVIVGFNGKDVLNIYDYMSILGNLRIGDKVEVVVLRNGERMSFQAVMDK